MAHRTSTSISRSTESPLTRFMVGRRARAGSPKVSEKSTTRLPPNRSRPNGPRRNISTSTCLAIYPASANSWQGIASWLSVWPIPLPAIPIRIPVSRPVPPHHGPGSFPLGQQPKNRG
ncbi:hypothetical protein VUR80DRAFT_2123 [Thermomyces stellatus]